VRLVVAIACLAGCRFSPGAGAGDAGIADAAIDGDPNRDSDGDGVRDDVDNCIAVPNPDQRDFDNDHRGDVCDRCPHLASVADPDADGDGVGDACDPRPTLAGDHRQYWLGFYDASEVASWTNTTQAGYGSVWSVTNHQLAETTNAFALLDSPDPLGDTYFAVGIEIVNANTTEVGFCGGDIPIGTQYYCCGASNVAAPMVRGASAWSGQTQIPDAHAFAGNLGAGAQLDVVGTMTATTSDCTYTQGATTATSSTARGPLAQGTAVFYTSAPVNYRYAFVVTIGS
jgi:hypothetical protein